ncbi:HAD-IC family P-type ATPase, partial [Candidatus Parcubacteria bacterium]|nr:HAD-IC family P-type ATPase [Candidatus Parcubacteria bacterium]
KEKQIQRKEIQHWHSKEVKEVLEGLQVDPTVGLSEKEVEERQKFARNVLPEAKPVSKTLLLLSQLKSPLVFVLVLAGLVTLFLQHFTDTIVIFIIVTLNTTVGFIQEYKASNTLRELKKILKVKALVLREGRIKEVFQEELVSGDIVLLRAGEKVPADLRLIESMGLKINEASLTGEWLSQEKDLAHLPEKTGLADRNNMAYMSTVIEEGEGKGVVVSVGIQTEIGKVAGALKEAKEEKTPYQKKLARFSKIIGIFIFVVISALFIEGIVLGKDMLEMFLTSVAVAVATIPEGLPISMTIVLAVSMRRLLKQKGLVRRLASAETLGSTSVIITDKTLTLTEGKMKIAEIVSFNKKKLFQAAVLANEAIIENPDDMASDWKVIGDPTSRALVEGAYHEGFEKSALDKQFTKVAFLGFDQKNKFIACLSKENQEKQNELFISGSPEKLLGLSTYFYSEKGKEKITKAKLKELEEKLSSLAGKGYRVIGFCHKTQQTKVKIKTEDVKGLVFIGFIALEDPLRETAKKAFKVCQKSGIRTIIATGDHFLTAKNIAEKLGLKINKENYLLGEDLDNLSDKDLFTKLKDIHLYARVEPHHKLRIVSLWQAMGEVVAMTGDGINDATALKKADIGVALGSATQVAQEASDLVLLDDDFSVLEKAVEEGRGILDNIRKVITFLLSDSLTEVILIAFALIAKLPLPLTAVQILWVNLLEAGPPNIALAFEPKEKDLMQKKPEKLKSPLLSKEMKTIIVWVGLFTNLMLVSLFLWLFKKYGYEQLDYIRTMVFAGLAIDSLFYLFACKSLRKNIWQINLFSNKFLIFAWLGSFLGLIIAIYLPFFQNILKTVSLGFTDWLILAGLGVVDLALIEFAKYHFIVKHQT